MPHWKLHKQVPQAQWHKCIRIYEHIANFKKSLSSWERRLSWQGRLNSQRISHWVADIEDGHDAQYVTWRKKGMPDFVSKQYHPISNETSATSHNSLKEVIMKSVLGTPTHQHSIQCRRASQGQLQPGQRSQGSHMILRCMVAPSQLA